LPIQINIGTAASSQDEALRTMIRLAIAPMRSGEKPIYAKRESAAAGLTLDEWRPFFNERHTGDNQASKNTAFARARKELVDKGLLKCSDDIYRLGDKAT